MGKLFLIKIVRKFGVIKKNKLKRGTAFAIMEKDENKVEKVNKKDGIFSDFKKKILYFCG